MPLEDLDKFVKKLQKDIIAEEIEQYNEYVVSLFHNPKNWGKLPEEELSIWHAYEGPCGDTMQFFLKIKDGIIEKVNFITDGCGATVAAGSQTTILIEGKPLEFAENLKPDNIEDALGGLPDDHKHCAELASRTLRRAVEKFRINKD